jgi:lipopolysaccharide/colanic/teichoic acid biosynthesis glycosyltransferase
VGFGRKSWVGYAPDTSKDRDALPAIRPGVLSPASIVAADSSDAETRRRLNMIYAKDYKAFNDLHIVWLNLRKLGS